MKIPSKVSLYFLNPSSQPTEMSALQFASLKMQEAGGDDTTSALMVEMRMLKKSLSSVAKLVRIRQERNLDINL